MTSLITQALLSGCVFGTLSCYFAHKREKNPYLWFFLGFIFGIFGIMAIFFAPMSSKKEALPEGTIPQTVVLTISGPKDKFWYYLDSAHQQQGPMSYEALTLRWRETKISPSTFVWNEELPDWKPLQEFLKDSATPQSQCSEKCLWNSPIGRTNLPDD